jgi:hypothetical protein
LRNHILKLSVIFFATEWLGATLPYVPMMLDHVDRSSFHHLLARTFPMRDFIGGKTMPVFGPQIFLPLMPDWPMDR